MRKTFQAYGFGINKRGYKVGIQYTVTSTTLSEAKSSAHSLAQQDGYKHIYISFVREVRHA